MRKIIFHTIVLMLLGLTLWGQKWVAGQQDRNPGIVLKPIPLVLNGWQGKELQWDERVLAMLKPDLTMHRYYRDDKGAIMVLYGVFYRSQGGGRTMHSPLNCYPGSGWEVVHKEKISVSGRKFTDTVIPARKMIIRKGLQRRTLLYWYYAGGRIVSNEYANKLMTIYSTLVHGRTDGGLIVFAGPVCRTEDCPDGLDNQFVTKVVDQLILQPIFKPTGHLETTENE